MSSLYFTCPAIRTITYTPGSFNTVNGVTNAVVPQIGHTNDVWTVTVDDDGIVDPADDHVVNLFKQNTGGSGHIIGDVSTVGPLPQTLKFAFQLTIQLAVGVENFDLDIWVGQGDTNGDDLWWIGSPSLAAQPHSLNLAYVPVFDATNQLVQVFNLGSLLVSHFLFVGQLVVAQDSPDQPNWLGGLPDNLFLDQINLPGTHDSAAINSNILPLYPRPTVIVYACHYTTLTAQMTSGVRLFDIRISVHESNGAFTFVTCHGAIGSSRGFNEFQTLPSALDEFHAFLAQNPTEFLAISLKVDAWNTVSPAQQPAALNALAALLHQYPVLAQEAMPTLEETRGLMYLLNRINDELRFGAPISWVDNTAGQLCEPTTGRDFELYVQDQFKGLPTFGATEEKFRVWTAALPNINPPVVDNNRRRLLLNYASATYFGVTGIYIMQDVLNFLGDATLAPDNMRLGWSLFDYEETAYPLSTGGRANVVQLFIASNAHYWNYPRPFRAG
ncbi:hypothetical protein [Agrobacterium vitis]|uniref:Phosphatidylinositol diacylglycerol-lyase n=1 Tax=Agrobacterium vitis TaxID=373 RepID=A0AAE2UX31_AGRVI|nr:hypothetical protein [Agrobacterium vitis]MBF2715654.1 hypothetical protein [Agrobacterium vitis]